MDRRDRITSIATRSTHVALSISALLLTACGVTGPVSRFTAIVADDLQCRTSNDNTVADMPGMTVAFTREGTDTASVVASFVANWPNPSGGGTANGAFIFLEIDGQRRDITSTNGGVLASEGGAALSNGTHGFNFVTDPIEPGTHRATIRWADNVLAGMGTICVAERSLVVYHD